MTSHDPAWGRTPSSVVVAAEMGTGKTVMAMLIAHAMQLLLTGQAK